MILGMLGAVVLGSLRLDAQEPSKSKSEESPKPAQVKKVSDPTRRVPPFFGQIGLSPDQKEEIYKVRAKHQEKIETLEKQIAAVRAEMLVECESKLTEVQKKSLVDRRTTAEAKKAKSAAPAKPSENGSD